MEIYHYDGATGVYLFASIADESSLDPPGTYLIPAHATALAPPDAGAQTVAVFADGGWALEPDWRGVPLYATADGALVSATAIGQTPTALAATNLAPPDATSTWSGTAWIADAAKVAAALARAKADAIAALLAYADSITAQITGDYPASEINSWPAQLVEARLVQAGQTPPAPSILQSLVAAYNDPSVTLASLAAAVIAKATAYQAIVAWAQMIRVSAQTQIGAATSAAQIETILATLRTTANAQAQALGLSVPS